MEKSDLHEDENSLKNKKLIFNVEEIINKCKEKDGIELLNYMCSIMKEKKRNILETLYKELGKDYLIFNLEKALNIENSGGLNKGKCMYPKKEEKKEKNDNIKNNNDNNDSTNEKKSTGGIFFSLVKKDPEAKNILNRATRKDFKESKQRKKVYKLMDKLNI
jgi:hypothetical protein